MRLVEVLQIAGTVLGILASAFAVAEKRLVERFRRAVATAPETAIAVPPLRIFSRWRLARLRSTGAVVTVDDGRPYLDEAVYSAGRRRRVMIAVSLVIVVLAIVVVVHGLLS